MTTNLKFRPTLAALAALLLLSSGGFAQGPLSLLRLFQAGGKSASRSHLLERIYLEWRLPTIWGQSLHTPLANGLQFARHYPKKVPNDLWPTFERRLVLAAGPSAGVRGYKAAAAKQMSVLEGLLAKNLQKSQGQVRHELNCITHHLNRVVSRRNAGDRVFLRLLRTGETVPAKDFERLAKDLNRTSKRLKSSTRRASSSSKAGGAERRHATDPSAVDEMKSKSSYGGRRPSPGASPLEVRDFMKVFLERLPKRSQSALERMYRNGKPLRRDVSVEQVRRVRSDLIKAFKRQFDHPSLQERGAAEKLLRWYFSEAIPGHRSLVSALFSASRIRVSANCGAHLIVG